ncbi:MAG: nuclear transport factor 2 family protein [Terriglobales bacterium]
MRKPGLIAGLLCFSFSLTGFAQGSASASKPLSPLEQTLIANTNAVPEAQKSRNADFLKRTLTDDFIFVGSEGKLHDKQEIVGSASEGELQDYYTYNMRVLPVNDEVAVVTYDCIIHMPEGDAPGMAPRYQHISDLWVKQNDQWRLKFQQATAQRPID